MFLGTFLGFGSFGWMVIGVGATIAYDLFTLCLVGVGVVSLRQVRASVRAQERAIQAQARPVLVLKRAAHSAEGEGRLEVENVGPGAGMEVEIHIKILPYVQGATDYGWGEGQPIQIVMGLDAHHKLHALGPGAVAGLEWYVPGPVAAVAVILARINCKDVYENEFSDAPRWVLSQCEPVGSGFFA